MKYLKRTSYNIKENFTYNLLKDRGIIGDNNWESYIKPTKENENSPFSLEYFITSSITSKLRKGSPPKKLQKQANKYMEKLG